PEEVARVVERHIGAGLTADECTLLGLLPIDCMPRTLEERVVAHADNRVAGTRRICLDERLLHAIHLQKRQKQRLYRLWQEMEMFRQTPGT
ncbi:MAG TPA: phosphohydrolase, partial [Methanolinea sp.]|nr:phosphohydrolase [Methanolinea sp.]